MSRGLTVIFRDSQDSLNSMVVEKVLDSESCKIISQGSVEDEGWKQVTACTRRKVPSPENN